MGHIFLYGSSGTGKSTIGKLLAESLKLPFVDVDRVMEINAGVPNPQIMEQRGEDEFRRIETEALQQAVAGRESVIALGAGALLRNENRNIAKSTLKIFLLATSFDTLVKRLSANPNK